MKNDFFNDNEIDRLIQAAINMDCSKLIEALDDLELSDIFKDN